MKIYFQKTNGGNSVIITDGETAKVFDAAPSGIYEGVDLYDENAADQLRKRFCELDETGDLNVFYNIYSPNEMPLEYVKNEIKNHSELIYDTEK